MKTIAIANQKGGTGKTTTAYNLGIALTQQGYRVLMVDFDPQGDLSFYCGVPPEQDLDQTITEAGVYTLEIPAGVIFDIKYDEFDPIMTGAKSNEAITLTFTVDTATGINGVQMNGADQKIFNLNGVRMNRVMKGINIINGKKVLVK